jgi:hypothetical protein
VIAVARSPKSSKGSTKEPTATEAEADIAADAAEPSDSGNGVEGESVEAEAADGPVLIDDEAPRDENEPSDLAADTETAPSVPDTDVPGAVPVGVITEAVVAEPTKDDRRAGTSVLALAFGGIVAGTIGFLIATYAMPEGQKAVSGVSTDPELAASVTEQSVRLEALAGDLAALAETLSGASTQVPTDLSPLSTRIDAVESTMGEAVATLQDLDQRLTALENRPVTPTGPDGSAAMEAQLEAFRRELDAVTADARARIEEAQARASDIETRAAASAAEAERRAAVSEVRAALESGASYSDALAKLPNPPDTLKAHAVDGVPTLASLQRDFPDVARTALAETQVVPEDSSVIDRAGAFLRRQTNARSLAPRDGNDADAILSRAEAALNSGDLETTISELDTLPDAAKPALSGWLARAQSRAEALAAAEQLSAPSN